MDLLSALVVTIDTAGRMLLVCQEIPALLILIYLVIKDLVDQPFARHLTSVLLIHSALITVIIQANPD